MLVISIPTKIAFTGNQTRINLHVSGSVEITPNMLKVETIATETRFCNHRRSVPFSHLILPQQKNTFLFITHTSTHACTDTSIFVPRITLKLFQQFNQTTYIQETWD